MPDSSRDGPGPGGVSDLERLFVKHTYLASIARLMVWASISMGRTDRPGWQLANEVFSGEYFRTHKLANLVEEDFFLWTQLAEAEEILRPTWERILEQIRTYDLSRLDQDVLKGVYQELVDPDDRHDLGEYYTPDWLCQRIIEEVLPREGYRKVLDPACGSGSFLRAAITHFLRSDSSSTRQRLSRVLDHVVGIDVHPLAVTIARATYVLALGPVIRAARRPIHIPVYMADSLFLPTEVQQLNLHDGEDVEIKFGGKTVHVPGSLVASADLFDRCLSAACSFAVEHAQTWSETPDRLEAYLEREAPAIKRPGDYQPIVRGVWALAVSLAELIRERNDSIWAFIVRNSYRPALLRRQFDVIIGNPPWLSYRYIADPQYQAEVKKRAVEDYAIAPRKQRLLTQMELATVFLAHSMGWFAREGARLAFVMPRSVLTGDQHENLRLRKYSPRCRFRLTAYWDLKDVKPLFQVPACVLFAQYSESPGSAADELKAEEWSGGLPAKECTWSEAQQYLTCKRTQARVIYMGDRCALSTSPGSPKPTAASPYRRSFRQGATIVPRCFYFVKAELDFPLDPDGLYWAETDPNQLGLAKAPYQDVTLKGEVEGCFFFYVALARHVLPFALLRPSLAVIPLAQDAQEVKVLTAEDMRDRGQRYFARWMGKAERIWLEKRGKKAPRQSVYEWLDYQAKLTGQNLSAENIVLYNSTGTNVSAVSLRRSRFDLPIIVEHTVYWGPVASPTEADYLAATLNSSVANEAIKPFQAMGLMGERHIEKKLMDLPIPRFDPRNPLHGDLARLGALARHKADRVLRSGDLPRSLGRQRAWIRDQLRNELAEIDRVVRQLL